MFKRFFTVTIVVLVVMLGLFQMRVQLLTAGFNTALSKADIRLLQLEGLQIGWNGVEIEQLVLGLGEENARQTLLGVELAYSFVNVSLESVSVSRALLTLPRDSDASADPPMVLSEFLRVLLAAPLRSVTVDSLEIKGISLPTIQPPLALAARWHDDVVEVTATDRDGELLVSIDGSAANSLALTVSVTRDQQPVLQLHASLNNTVGQSNIEGEGRLFLRSARPLLAQLIEIPPALATVSGEVVFQMQGRVHRGVEALQLQLMPETSLALGVHQSESGFDVALAYPQGVLVTLEAGAEQTYALSLTAQTVNFQIDDKPTGIHSKGQFTDIQCQYGSALVCHSALALTLGASTLRLPGQPEVIAENLQLQWSAQLLLENDELVVTLAAGEWLRVESLVRAEIHASDVALVASRAGTLSYDLSTGAVAFEAQQLQLRLPRVTIPEFSLATGIILQNLSLKHSPQDGLSGAVHLQSDAINLQRPDTWLPAVAVACELVLEDNRLDVVAQVNSDSGQDLFELTANYQLQSQRGSAHLLAQDISFDNDGKRLSQVFSHWPFDWDIYDGQVSLDARVQWQDGGEATEIQAQFEQSLRGVAGVYQSIGFLGLDSTFSGQFLSPDKLRSTQPIQVSLSSLDVGVPIENITASFTVDTANSQLHVDALQANMLGGRVWIDETLYRADRPHNPVYIGVDGVHLDQILALAGYDAVQASGIISGLLPLDINTAGVTMKRGMLAAKAPGGVFHYRTEIAPGTNPAMVQVLQALGNYQYSVFQVEADYLENGDLVLAMVLRGSNPDLQQGRPIHLNLNVTDNIPTLLRSLQAGRAIADTVSKKLGGGGAGSG